MEMEEMLEQSGGKRDELIATEMLVSAKAAVRTYAVALTEAASPRSRADACSNALGSSACSRSLM